MTISSGRHTLYNMRAMRLGVGSTMLMLLLIGALSCSGSKEQSEEKGWEEATHTPLATEQIAQPVEDVEEPCTYATYKSNNALLASTDAPCNQGTEPLSAFLVSFRRDAGVVRSRALLPSGVTPPHVVEDPFRIISPDSTGYFASWIIMEQELSWRPEHTFEEGLRKTVDWYLTNEKWLAHVTSGAYRSYYQDMYSHR